MARYIRSRVAGASYFFTVALEDRSATWLVDHIDDLRTCLLRVREVRPFEVDAMVVLPDHLHAIWTLPAGDDDYPLRWRLLKRGFSQTLQGAGLTLPRRGSDERALWQRRYWEHQIRDDVDFERHVDYIHFNPVKHGLVQRCADWPHSSFHRFVKAGLVAADWGISAELRGNFGE